MLCNLSGKADSLRDADCDKIPGLVKSSRVQQSNAITAKSRPHFVMVWSASALQQLKCEVNNTDHLLTMRNLLRCEDMMLTSVWMLFWHVLANWMWWKTKDTPHGNNPPQRHQPLLTEQCILKEHKNCTAVQILFHYWSQLLVCILIVINGLFCFCYISSIHWRFINCCSVHLPFG